MSKPNAFACIQDDIFSAIGRVRSVSNSTELRAAAKWGTRMCEPSSSNNEVSNLYSIKMIRYILVVNIKQYL